MNNTNIQTINFNNQQLLTVEKDGVKYVAVKPICENLGLAWAAQFVKIKENQILNGSVSIIEIVAEDGKNREMVCLPIDMINGWLFTINPNKVSEEIRPLVIYYQKECYRALFEFWNKPKEFALPQNYLEALKALVESEESRQQLMLENKQQAEYIEEVKPKVYYYDLILSNPSLVNIRTIAQDYGMSAQKMNKLLHDLKIQYKDKDGIWKVYAKYAAADYAKLHTTVLHPETPKETIVNHLKWTQKGRLFIYDLLKSEGYLPLCEQS